MKLNFVSDLHQEFLGYKWDLVKTDADVIILAGDIGQGVLGVEWAIRQSEKLDIPIIYIFGNHEYFKNDFSIIDHAKEYTDGTNVRVLNRDIVEFEDYRILGTTLWTDYCLYGEPSKKVAMHAAQDCIADHSLITYDGHIFTTEDALSEHKKDLEFLNIALQSTDKNIVVTHHAPTYHASHPSFRGDMCTPAFCSDLEGFIAERKPKVWISGHSHYAYRKQIWDTLCISNPKGYKFEGVLHFDPELIIEV